MPPPSRIPTRNVTTRLTIASENNENLPPSNSSRHATQRRSASKLASTSKPRISTTGVRDRTNAQAPAAIEISVQLPSSDGGRGDGNEDGFEETEPGRRVSREGEDLEGTEGAQMTAISVQGITRAGSLLPVPSNRRASRSRSRSRSKSPQILPPSKPTYATLTSRRRSAAAALRRLSVSCPNPDAANVPDLATAEVGTSSIAKPSRRSSLRPKPRPSEILPVPIGPPQHPPEIDDEDADDGDAAGDDELMLLPSERGRGKGEGKEGMAQKWDRERSRSRSRSQSVAPPLEHDAAGADGKEAAEGEPEEFDWGGFDGGDFGPEAPEDPESNASTAPDLGNNLAQHEGTIVNPGTDEAGAIEREGDEDRGDRDTERSGEPNDGEENTAEDRFGSQGFTGDEEEEEDRKDFLKLDDQASSDNEPEVVNDEDDLPFADQPRYSMSQSPSTTTQRDQTPPRAFQEGRSYSEIFPPLSPNTTGEYDEVEPLRFSSSPPPDSGPEESPIAEEFEQKLVEAQRSAPVRLASPFLETAALPQETIKGGSATLEASTTKPREVTPLPPAYLKFEQEAFSSPGPASLLSPSGLFSRAFAARTRSLTPVNPSHSPRQIPQLDFVPLPSPRSRSARLQLPPRSPSTLSTTNSATVATTRARQPSPLALATTLPPVQQEWTRGPGFFRSSSFTPPPVRSSFDRKGKAKAANQDAPGEDDDADEGAEQSREYWEPGAMTATSPHVSERARSVDLGVDRDLEHEEEEEEEDEISLVQQPSSSPSNNVDEQQPAIPPPTPSKDRSPSFQGSFSHDDGHGHESDTSMRSPVASLRSRHSSAAASPPRSPNSGDYIMSSPVGSIRSMRSLEVSTSSPRSVTSNKKLPATPPPGGAEAGGIDDEKMLSPSPTRSVSVAEGVSGTRPGLRRSPSRLEELVEAGKEKLTGLLSFGSPRFVAPLRSDASTSTIQHEVPGSTSAEQVSNAALQAEMEDVPARLGADDDDQPFPQVETRVAVEFDRSVTSKANMTADESTFSNLSYADSSRRRRRPSRNRTSTTSSLPVIEISSTDAKAAARAAAILKVYHKYVEQGIEGSLARDEASRVIREAERSGKDVDETALNDDGDEEDEEEEELRTLLLDAEEEVREAFGRGLSTSSSERSTPLEVTARTESIPERNPPPHDDEDDEEEEVRSVLLSNHSRSPSVPQQTSPSSSIASRSAATSHVRSRSASGLSSVVGERWTSQEWRRLEQSLVELKRKIKHERREIEAIEVVEAFLHKWGVQKEELSGDWEWDKLLIRVEAIKARRARDVREHRAGSQISSLSVSSNAPSDSSSRVAEEGSGSGSGGSGETDRDETASPPRAVVVKEEEFEQSLQPSDHGSDSEPEEDEEDDDDERTRDPHDDTFFSTNRRLRRTRRTSMPHTRLPTALSNPRLAHIYDDAPAPEKPRLPIKEMLKRGHSAEPAASIFVESTTPEPDESRDANVDEVEPTSTSAQRFFSYLGSFVRRSPAPSPSTSKFAPSSSLSPEPESSEMTESRLVRPPLVSRPSSDREPTFETRQRKIRPLPHSSSHDSSTLSVPSISVSTPVASSLRSTLSLPTPSTTTTTSGTTRGNRSIRRRRSSGEEGGRVWEAVIAIEEAESSREEEEARIVELLRSGSAKRKASGGDLRKKVQRAGGGRV